MPSDIDAIRFLAAARKRGLEVRRDFLLIGYDGQLLTDMLVTPLSTIFQPFLELGEKAAESIVQLIEGKPVENAVIAPWLIERDSTRPL
ncbi:HTH-type transcriptional regulator DegA [bioreactor metagenome]|uniref:HTH-type transcriptional regulator DegA n=1 Tax=bioreactor metagenome TaxID=1076179 RepID=A0A645H0T7_9ZZZZ